MSTASFPTLREEIDWLLAQQPLLLKLGVMTSRLVEASEMLRWLEIAFELHGLEDVELAQWLTKLMIDALWSLGDETNPRANAARRLYGSDPATMGLPLKSRRKRARAILLVDRSDGEKAISSDWWSKVWEPGILTDAAWFLGVAARAE